MGETGPARGLSDAARGPAARGLPARFPLRFLRDERGATAIEYGLIVGLLALVIISSVYAFGDALNAKFEDITSAVEETGGD